MLQLPADFEALMRLQLNEEFDHFLHSLNQAAPTSIRINPYKTASSHLEIDSSVAWASNAYYLNSRPSFTFDPYFHAGHYYVQEASSMFIEHALHNSVNLKEDLKVLDLCAAPGGKSTHLLSLISKNSLLISNEVIATRASILVENISKWGRANCIVTNNEPEHFKAFQNCFDVVLIDAPCSGEGMFRKDPDAIQEWNLNNVNICSSRQIRILNEAADLVKEGGVLIYSTCTFNLKEDVDPITQLFETGEWESIRIPIAQFEGIVERVETKDQAIYGYHFYPHKIRGEGFFLSALRKISTEHSNWPKVKKDNNFLNKKDKEVIKNYMDTSQYNCITHDQSVLCFPSSLEKEMLGILNTSLRIKKFGINMGQLIREELIPEHTYALSEFASDYFDNVDLSYEEAISYLQKNNFNLNTSAKGWKIMRYEKANLGFAKLMGNRMNNHYPKEWRIRSEMN